MLSLFWYCASDFPTQNRWKTKRDAGLFCISSASKWIVFSSILVSFWGPFWNLGGGLGGSWVLEAPKLGFWSILDRFWDPSWGQVGSNFEALERPGASWHLLGRSLCGLEPFFFRSHDRFLFASHFTSISDRKTTPKSLKHRWRIHAHMKQKKKAYFHASCSEFSR